MKFALSSVNLILKLIAVQSANFAKLGIQVTEENLSTLMESVNTFARKMVIVGPEDITKVVLTVESVRYVSSLKESIIHRIYSFIFYYKLLLRYFCENYCLNFFKLIDTPIPPVDSKPKIKSFGSFRWLVLDYSVARKLTENGRRIVTHFCPYANGTSSNDPKANYVILCRSTLERFGVNK